MVSGAYTKVANVFWLIAAQQPGDAVFERLDPPRRAAVLMALLGLALVGLALIIFIMIGGHWVRRLARHRPFPRAFETNEGAPSGTPRIPAELPADLKTEDTLLLEKGFEETKVEQ